MRRQSKSILAEQQDVPMPAQTLEGPVGAVWSKLSMNAETAETIVDQLAMLGAHGFFCQLRDCQGPPDSFTKCCTVGERDLFHEWVALPADQAALYESFRDYYYVQINRLRKVATEAKKPRLSEVKDKLRADRFSADKETE